MKKLKFLIPIIVVAILAGGGYYGYHSWQKAKEAEFLLSDPRTKDAYEIIQKRNKEVKENPDFYDGWMSLGFHWKGIGEVLNNEEYMRRAVKMYDQVIKRWGSDAYLPFLNRANAYVFLKEYEKAEQDLKIASEIDPGEQSLYINLAELYRYHMDKTKQEVMAVYERGIKRVVGGGNLVSSYASYLKEVEEYEKALKLYKVLDQAYPDKTFDKVIEEIEVLMEA